ncbi:MAG TPA: tRNA (adenosine(37)-N6)-threonylcarbamoyltransferase complex dimerization subunit type 1 TsaB [Pseudolabrys sp.]|nr:tRNA (adenosine(37)-N6)-threonylcarbamoyltransferase complex dimerization subunit type 1 TsaB [Pseudolabrys sp.]
MRVFAIDTALEACSAAVLDTGHGAIVAHESIPMARGHAEALMPLIARVIAASKLDFSQIDRFAVTTGPGSFTGLRVGIAAARGLGLAAAKPVIGLSTLAAFAAPLIAADATIPVVVAIDARHDHVYLQVFASGARTLVTPRVVRLAEALQLARGGAPRIIGSAAKMLAALWLGPDRPPTSVDAATAPEIGWVARLGAAADENASPPKPFYLRPPDAQPQHAAQLARR